jgi:hypothetical protein
MTKAPATSTTTAIYRPARVTNSSEIYSNCRLKEYGLDQKVFDYAWKGYQRLQDRKLVTGHYLVICDMSQSSLNKRLYLIDIGNQQMLLNTYVAHGKNSGLAYASHFSNNPSSLQSSLGFYATGSTYIGEHGLSLRLLGLEKGYNDKAYERSIVIHGASYVNEARAHAGGYMGRSFGCPAVPEKESKQIIELIRNGNCLFIYHPSGNYILGSKLLND